MNYEELADKIRALGETPSARQQARAWLEEWIGNIQSVDDTRGAFKVQAALSAAHIKFPGICREAEGGRETLVNYAMRMHDAKAPSEQYPLKYVLGKMHFLHREPPLDVPKSYLPPEMS